MPHSRPRERPAAGHHGADGGIEMGATHGPEQLDEHVQPAHRGECVDQQREARLSAREALDPRWIDTRKRLEGDLDHILLMALEKPIERRYASVDALSADIERYLQARPVTARGASPLYVLGRFVRRNRWAVLAGAVGGQHGRGQSADMAIAIAQDHNRPGQFGRLQHGGRVEFEQVQLPLVGLRVEARGAIVAQPDGRKGGGGLIGPGNHQPVVMGLQARNHHRIAPVECVGRRRPLQERSWAGRAGSGA